MDLKFILGTLIIDAQAESSMVLQRFAKKIVDAGPIHGTNAIRKCMIENPEPEQIGLTAVEIYANCVAINKTWDTAMQVIDGRVCVPHLFAASPDKAWRELALPDDLHKDIAEAINKMEAGRMHEAGELAKQGIDAAMDSVKH